MKSAHPIALTQLEATYLSDSISMHQHGPPNALQEEGSPYPDLLLKIGGAILELGLDENKEGRATIRCTINELWVMREVAKSSAMIGSERVGFELLHKIFEGIQVLEGELANISDLRVSSVDEPSKHDLNLEMKQVRDKFGEENDDDTAVAQ